MGRTGKVENAKSGAKRTRGRPRTKETKTNSATKRLRRRDSDSVNGRKSPQRENSLSPTHQDPPQLEPMPAVDEDEDLDIPMGFSALNSVDAYLCPGKCIVICPLASCRKKFSNPIDLVSHLRIYHESETFPSLKIYTCPTCLTTRFSSHTTSSDLTLLSEHAARYHGQNFKQVFVCFWFLSRFSQTEFIYFCTIVLDILTGDKSTQQKEENNLLKKEVSCMASQPQPDTHYHPILPLVPNSASSELRSDVATSNAARVNADSLGLRISSAVLPQASSAGHYIQISPVPPKLPGGAAPAPQPPQPVLAALAAAAVSGQLQTSLPTGGQALLLPSHTPPSSSSSAAAVAAAPDPILINSASIYTPAHAKQLPVFISSSTASCTTPDVAQTIASVASKLSTHSASTEAAIETLKQLMQSAAVAKAQQTTPSGTPLQAPATVTLTQPTVATRNTVLQTSPSTLLSDGGQQRGVSVPKVVTKVDEPQSTQPLVYPFVQSVTVSSSSSSSGNAAVTTSSPVTVMTSNNELDSSSDLSPNASANADLLTLARLSVKQATAEASSQEAQQSTSTAPRNRRLLPRKSANTAATSTPILVRKRAALPPLAVKPPKESVAPLITPTKLAAPTPAHFSPLIPAPNNTEHVAMAPAVAPAASETIRQEEAPLMTAALISPPRPAPSTSTLIPSSLGSVLAKSRLLQASSYISVQPRLSSIQSSGNHLIQRVPPSNRPAPLQKILPRPNAGAVAATSAKDLRPLVYPVQSLPLQASTPAVAQVCPPVATTATKTQCLTVVHPSTSSSQINGNSAAATVTTKNTPSSPSELNVST
uniref:C2H2-type domain-containing protein n=1 Tax=Mesocestoides corti TaxID=53468 RepID=A0A5K3FPX3_MESCO